MTRPIGDTIQDRLQNRLETDPDGRAISFYKPGQPVEWQSFSEFHSAAAAVATDLIDRGLEPGDVAVIVLPSGELSATTLMAVLLANARPLLVAPPAILGVNSDLPRILRHSIKRSEAKMVVVPGSMLDDDDVLKQIRADGTIIVAGEELTGEGSPITPVPSVKPDDFAALQLTSGTTGLPKVCVWTQTAVLAALDGMIDAMDLTVDDVCFNWTPLYHDMGLVNNFLTCMSGNVPLVLMDPHAFVKRPSAWLRGIAETGTTVTWAPNFAFALVTERTPPKAMEGVRLDGVRGFWNAAERIHARTYADFADTFEPYGLKREALRTNFGCAENIGGATFTTAGEPYAVEHVDRNSLHDGGEAVVGDPSDPDTLAVVGVGKGYPGLDIYVLDPDDVPMYDGHIGRVALRSPSRLVGYMGDPEATAEALKGDLLVTGDLGYLRDGELFWVGRSQERITVRGKKIDPSDFEPILFDVDGLRQGCFAAFGVDDDESGTESIVVVSEVRDAENPDLASVSGEIRRQVLARLGVGVSDVVLVKSGTLTKTSSGKRRHRHFKQMYLSGELEAQSLAADA